MGVRNLETYLEKESRKGCYKVDLPGIVSKYRKVSNNSTPVIVVDGMSCLRPLYGKLSWLNGGQFKEFYEIIQKFINNFTQLGCELVVYFDGPVQNIKLPVWKKRRLHSAEEISAIFDKLHKGPGFLENGRTNCLPNGLGWLFLYLLAQHENCRVMKALRECDEEIAQYAFKNKCFAILGQDTDFVIYRGAMYYLSIKHLDLDRMTTICYDGVNLCVELGIHNNCLPLLASLLGNDIIEFDSLKPFHQSLRRRSRQRNIILLVAEFIRRLRHVDLSQIASQVFGAIEQADLLKKSVSSYDLHSISSDKIREEKITSDNKNWLEIIEFSKKKYIHSVYTAPLYDILLLNRFHSSTCLEDYRDQNIIVPVGNILKELRRSIYGILLHEKPTFQGSYTVVSELVMTGFNSMDSFVEVLPKYLEKVEHPGLMALWTSKEKHIEDVRWDILGEVFKADPDAIKYVPPWFIIPALSARYFKDQFPSVSDWEINALIASTVCVQHYSAQELARLPSGPLTSRQIWMYTALSRTFATVNNLLFYIGEPIPLTHTLPYKYTDGKLFHDKYRKSSKNANVESLCEHKVENLEMFNLLRYFITS